MNYYAPQMTTSGGGQYYTMAPQSAFIQQPFYAAQQFIAQPIYTGDPQGNFVNFTPRHQYPYSNKRRAPGHGSQYPNKKAK